MSVRYTHICLLEPQKSVYIFGVIICNLTEVVIWGPKQGWFRNVNWVWWPGLATIVGNNQAQYPEVADSTWAWMLPARWPMCNCPRREPYFSPSFSHISPPTVLICVIFIYISIKIIIATKMGQNGAVLGQIPHFGPFPFEEISKRGAKKVENQPSPNTLFKPQDDLVS